MPVVCDGTTRHECRCVCEIKTSSAVSIISTPIYFADTQLLERVIGATPILPRLVHLAPIYRVYRLKLSGLSKCSGVRLGGASSWSNCITLLQCFALYAQALHTVSGSLFKGLLRHIRRVATFVYADNADSMNDDMK